MALTVNEALRILRERWLVVLLCLLVAAAGAGIATSLTPRQYSSDVTLYVSLQGQAKDSDEAYQASQLAKERVNSYAPLLKDQRITQPVVDRLQLPMTAEQLASRITVTTTPDTVVLSAAVTDTSPEQASAIANALAEEFVGLVGQLEEPIGPTAAAAPARPGVAAAPVAEPARIGVEIIRPAAPQPTPISPNVPFNLALGIALGLLVGIAAAFVRNARDTRVRSAARLQELTGAPVLSEIASDRDARLHPLTLGAPPGSARVESFRKLRTNLQFLEPTRPHRVVVVTSATVGEGKSTTACNLALALADAGSRVLLIDLNLRLPQVDRYLQVEPGAGVANVLSGRIAVKNAVLRWVDGGLDVLPAGPVPFNPSELLASRATAALLDEVRQRYDYVIIDAPAVLPVTDAAAVAARADGVVLVVRYGRTSEEQVAAAVNGLEAVGAPLLGVALTGTPPSRWRRGRAGSYPEPDPAPPTRGTPAPGGRGHIDGVMPGPRPATPIGTPTGSIPTGGAPNGSVIDTGGEPHNGAANGTPHNGAANGTPNNGIPAGGTVSPMPGRGENLPHGASEQRPSPSPRG